MRLNFSDIVSASLLTIKVLARPGTPINSAWPRAKRQIASRSITSVLADDDLAQLLPEPGVGIPQMIDRLNVVLIEPLVGRDIRGLRHERIPRGMRR